MLHRWPPNVASTQKQALIGTTPHWKAIWIDTTRLELVVFGALECKQLKSEGNLELLESLEGVSLAVD